MRQPAVAATQRSRVAAAAPESTAARARSSPAASASSAGVAGSSYTARAAPALSSTASRTAPGSPASVRRTTSALWAASPPRRSAVSLRASPRAAGSMVVVTHLAAVHLPHRGRRGRRQLVEPVVAAEHPGVDAAGGEHAGHHRRHPRVGAAHGLRGRAGRVAERAEDVERRADAELAARCRGVPHGRVEGGREAEGDAGLLGHLGHPLGGQVQPDAERLEHVGAAGLRGGRPVAVLDDLRARPGGHDRGHGGDVHAHRPVPAGADDVEQPPGYVDRGAGGVHRVGQAGDLVDGLALGLEPDREPGDLGGGRLAGEDLPHRPAGLLGGQVGAGDEGREDLSPRRHAPGAGAAR